MMIYMAKEPASREARSRMVHSAAELQRSAGVNGVGFAEIIAHSGAPRGSIYHHFPDGRVQLAVEATSYAAEAMADDVRAILAAATDVHEALDAFVAVWLDIMRRGDFQTGCAVAAAAMDSRSAPKLRAAANAGFQLWEQLLQDAFTVAGVPETRTRALAVTVLAAIEGAIILSRADDSPEPLELAAGELHRLIDLG
jgi:AcrR family transcriptional regulator